MTHAGKKKVEPDGVFLATSGVLSQELPVVYLEVAYSQTEESVDAKARAWFKVPSVSIYSCFRDMLSVAETTQIGETGLCISVRQLRGPVYSKAQHRAGRTDLRLASCAYLVLRKARRHGRSSSGFGRH